MPGISLSDFFKRKRSASEIKSEILNEYFKAWAAILLGGQKYKNIDKLLYVDLFSGPGLYDDGKPSTPIKILNSIYNSNGKIIDFNKSVLTIFNDKNTRLSNKLKENIESLPFYNDLIHKPIIANEIATDSILKEALQSGIPSLTFIDPLGYGYSQKMLLYSVENWGSDLFVLFNINRIRAAVKNKLVKKNMLGIFAEYYDSISNYYSVELSPYKREKFILEVFERIFSDRGYKSLKFKVNFPNRKQTSHYLFFISRVNIAITRAKEIMTKYSDVQPDGVPIFSANSIQDSIFFPSIAEYSIEKLVDILNDNRIDYNNKTIEEIYIEHNYGTNYIKQNYKDAVQNLINSNTIFLMDKNNNKTERLTYTAKIIFN